ncbi:MAG: hypothetical protein ABIG28_01075 [archaeon]
MSDYTDFFIVREDKPPQTITYEASLFFGITSESLEKYLIISKPVGGVSQVTLSPKIRMPSSRLTTSQIEDALTTAGKDRTKTADILDLKRPDLWVLMRLHDIRQKYL